MNGETLNTEESPIDAAYLAAYETGLPPEPPREDSSGIPAFGKYHFRFDGGKGGFTRKQKPYARISATVIAGPEGTVGRKATDDIYFLAADTKKNEAGEDVPKSAEDIAKAQKFLMQTISKIAKQLGFLQGMPRPPLTEASLNEWVAQFSGQECIMGASPRGNFTRFRWRSLAALDAEVKIGGQTISALEDATLAITAEDSKEKEASVGGMKMSRPSEDF